MSHSALAQATPSAATANSAPAATAKPSAQDAAEAKRRFQAGLKLYAEHAIAEALVEFETSYRLGNRVSALKNVAQCERDLKNFAEAYEAYQRMLDVHAADLKTSEKEAVQRALGELAIVTGTIAITVDQPGAEIELDGHLLGTSPLASAKRIGAAKTHTLRVTLAGFEPFSRDLAVQSEEKATVDVALAAETTTGHVAVREQDGHDVHVFVDGEDEGAAPWEGDLPPGSHTLEVKGATFASERRSFTVEKKGHLDLVVVAQTTQGRLRVTTNPMSATIRVDGKTMATGTWDAELAPGPHRIEVAAEGLPTAFRDVTVERGQLVALEIPLQGRNAETPEYRGIYSRIAPFVALAPGAPDPIATPSDVHTHFALGGDLRIGYSLDVFSFEVLASLIVDHFDAAPDNVSTAANTVNLSQSTVDVTSVGGFFGAGARVTSKDSTTRFTFGVTPGVSVHSISAGTNGNGNTTCQAALNQCPTNGSNDSSISGGYAAPGVVFDGGILIGGTPGAKFFLGLRALLDFPGDLKLGPDTNGQLPSDLYYPGRALQVTRSPTFFVGPTLGIQFGH